MAKKKLNSQVATECPLQAVLLADGFDKKFQPITLEQPKVLLPLLNVPMIDYSLAWLESVGVEEDFVVCYWCMNVTLYMEISCLLMANMSLTQALLDHKERKEKDSIAIITMVIKKSKPSSLVMAIDPNTKELLCYEDKGLVLDNHVVKVHINKEDCYIHICSPEVLKLLSNDIMGYTIFTHEIHSSYAARVESLTRYDTVSKDIIQWRTYPLVPDIQSSGNCPIKLERQGVYKGLDIKLSSSARVGPFTLISNSVIGKGYCIGSNVSIEGSYIWDNVTIEDGWQLNDALICDGVIKTGAF
ncbi:hypothetical protein MKW94_026574 [Papaver nudicaule]|uniref:Nucleotidyl transferase domain-containing protein n=1 Tax=Papaver nudicaule TaxID=74823 RepID=A0AA41S5V8_PAPNU|nr:hypothetical protein [Papaver nudicaule]MCL7039990.1 hypothetical protein [Papaver nudicaule]